MQSTKNILFLLSALLLIGCGKKQTYTLVWEDTFDGDTLNTAFWNIEDNARGGGNYEMQYYSPRNMSIENHPVTGERCLVLTARREDYGNRPATSARLNTQDKVTVQYGKVEARIAFPNTADGLYRLFGCWATTSLVIWATTIRSIPVQPSWRSPVRSYTRCGEIDIVEMGHQDGIRKGLQDRYFNGAAHWGEAFNDGRYPNKAGVCEAPYSVQDGFHLFTLVWSEDSLAMYLDQDRFPDVAPYFALSLRDKGINQPGYYFNKPFYILLNLAVGGHFPGMPTSPKYPEQVTADDPNFQRISALPSDGTPVKMYVDYVRVYQYNE